MAPSYPALIQRSGTGIKDVKHCWRGESTEMTCGVSTASPASDAKGMGSVSVSAVR